MRHSGGSSSLLTQGRHTAGHCGGAATQRVGTPKSRLDAHFLERGQAATIAAPSRPSDTCASLSTTQRVSRLALVNPHATTRDCKGKNAHSVRTESVAPVLWG